MRIGGSAPAPGRGAGAVPAARRGPLRALVVATSLLLLGLPGALAGPGVPGLAVSPAAAAESDPVIATAGDIACDIGGTPSSSKCRQNDTADLVVGMNPDAVLPLGDAQYEKGTAAAFARMYDPSWGRVKSISHPIPGNHEYETAGAAGYFQYFGAAAGDPSQGYYSWDIGAWHMIALNSNCSEVSCDAGSPQESWLRADLAASRGKCTLAYFHHPRFSSGNPTSSVAPFWKALYEAHADVVLSGHSHVYEHFAPQSPTGAADPMGLREFVVGTGGIGFGSLGAVKPNTVTRQNNTFGVLKLVLHGSSYDWQFLPIAGSSWTDSGSATCHAGGPAAPSGLTVAGTPTSSSVGLQWTASRSTGVAGYRVHRDGATTPLNSTLIAGTGYTDTTVSPSTTYSYRVTAVDAGGAESPPSDPVTVTTPGIDGATVLEVPVRVGSDDAEEQPTGPVDLASSDLELVTDGTAAQTVGLRFTGVAVPTGATITNAYVQFQVDEVSTVATSLTVAGQAADNPPTFATTALDVSSRPRTTASVAWSPPAWSTVGDRGVEQRTPNLAPVVQEIVSRPGWASGNALALVVTGSGRRTAEAVESGASLAPVLHLEYLPPGSGGVNAAPVVNAGADLAVTLPAGAALAGSVSDDGLPNPPGAVTAAWSVVSGPGAVTFADASAPATTATFGAAGVYVLRLTATDGALQASDDVAVTVTDSGPDNAAPVVSAGPDVSVTRPDGATLAGSVTDDGLPDPPALVTATWSTVSGPGTVTFADANAASTTATFSTAGGYVLRLTGDDGALQASDDVTVTVSDPAGSEPVVLDVPVRAGADDAEERTSTGAVTLTSGDLNLGTDAARPQTVAMRFTGVSLPPGAHVTAAWLQFNVDEVSTGAAAVTFTGEAADDAGGFTAVTRSLSALPRTTASVGWSPPEWPTVLARGPDQRTPNLAPIVQEIVDRPGWAGGHALVVFGTGTGSRVADSFEGGAARAPVLHLEYTS